MASSYLWRNIGSNGNRKTMTFSAWVKRSGTGTASIFTTGSGAERDMLLFESSGIIQFSRYNGSYLYKLQTNAKYLDTNGWYHIVAVLDTPQATEANRMKLYVNGEQVTSFSAASYPSQDYQSNYNQSGYTQYVGQDSDGNFDFDGCMSHVHYVDGLALTPATFGSTDSTTGEWKITTSPTVSDYGTNGFFVLKDNNSGTDQSGEGNNLTTQGTITETKDNPSNVFATLSPNIVPKNSTGTGISAGNTRFTNGNAVWQTEASAFGVTSGKWYFEVQFQNNGGGDRRFRWGYQTQDYVNKTGNGTVLGGTNANAVAFMTNGYADSYGGYVINTTATNLTSDGDINEDNAVYGFALDLDNRKMYGHFNGTWLNSANPSNGTNGIDISSHVNVGDTLFPAFTTHLSNININFGNGVLDTTALTGTTYNDADGNGIFKYTVPTNYRALYTKGLNQ